MSANSIVELVATKVRFFSPNDESAFFEWLCRLTCIESYEGRGVSIYIYIDNLKVDEENLRELLSLFRRFDIQLKQLSVFDDDRFASWFRNKTAYWYKSVFEVD